MRFPASAGLCAAFALPVAGAGFACAERKASDPAPVVEDENMAQPIEIQLDARIENGRLVVDYEMRNALDEPLLVFDRLWDREAGALDPDFCYSTVGVLTLLRREVDEMPFGLHVEDPEVPYARYVEAGAVERATLRVDLPLEERGAFLHITRRGPEERVPVKRIALRIGYAPLPDPDLLPSPIDIDGEALYLLSHPFASEIQSKVTSDPFEIGFEAVRRRED